MKTLKTFSRYLSSGLIASAVSAAAYGGVVAINGIFDILGRFYVDDAFLSLALLAGPALIVVIHRRLHGRPGAPYAALWTGLPLNGLGFFLFLRGFKANENHIPTGPFSGMENVFEMLLGAYIFLAGMLLALGATLALFSRPAAATGTEFSREPSHRSLTVKLALSFMAALIGWGSWALLGSGKHLINEVATRDLAGARLAVLCGADVNAGALEAAARGGQNRMVAFLLGKGAPTGGVSPYSLSSNVPTARLLLAAGISPEVISAGLEQAALRNHFDVCDLLLAAGAPVNARNSGGLTPLHRAAQLGKPDAVSYLLAHGADASLKGPEGQRPLDLAKKALAEFDRNYKDYVEREKHPDPSDAYRAKAKVVTPEQHAAGRKPFLDTIALLSGAQRG